MFAIPDHVRPIRDAVRSYIEEEVEPHEPELVKSPPGVSPLVAELRDKARARGVYALGHPAEYGGGGLPFRDYMYVNEAIGRCEVAITPLNTATAHTALMIDRHCSPEWKARLLPGMTVGDIEVAFALTEPDVASSDPTQLATTAELVDGEWVIDGSKWFISLLDQASYVVVMCRTEGDDVEPHGRFSMIIVPTDAPGFSLVRPLEVLGLRGPNSGHYEIAFDGVRVPFDNLVGQRGNGFVIAQDRLGPGRIYHCMRWLGMAQRAFDLMCRRANERTIQGTPLGDRQLVQKFVFDSYRDIKAARLLVLDAAVKIDAGEQARNEISLIKVVCASMAHDVIDRAMQVHGALGMSDATPLERMYRSIRTGRIVDGPDETHVQRVGRRLLAQFTKDGATWDFDE